ncbi:MAG: hypothetical protein KDJ26_06770, partial [Alphaproteobacteria bacterium]|nr:hypothetical protein [Alphaproteobacteria bacterium]
MKLGFLIACILCAIYSPAQARDITPFNECATLRNMSDQSIMGVVRTAPFKTTTGNIQRHEAAFRLEADETVEICSTGPFYEGYKVELIILKCMQ